MRALIIAGCLLLGSAAVSCVAAEDAYPTRPITFIAILYGGELKVMGRVDELLKAQDETQILSSKLSDAAVQEVQEVLKRHGARIYPDCSLVFQTLREGSSSIPPA